MFSHLIGNPLAKRLLQKMAQEDEIPSTLLLVGPEGVGKSCFAKAFAKNLLGEKNRADLLVLSPEEKSGLHPIESIRQMIQEAALPPLESSKRIFLIEDAEKMLPTSSNALLKILEEPPSHSFFFLVTKDADGLLPTVVSRSRRIDFFSIPSEELAQYLQKHENKNDLDAKKIALLSNGSLTRSKEICSGVHDPLIALFKEWLEKKELKTLEKIEETLLETQVDFLFSLVIEDLKARGKWDEKSAKLLIESHKAYQHHVKIKTILYQIAFF